MVQRLFACSVESGGEGWLGRFPFGKRAIDAVSERALVIVARETHLDFEFAAVTPGFEKNGVDSWIECAVDDE